MTLTVIPMSNLLSISSEEEINKLLFSFSRLLQLLNRKIPINRVIYAFMGIFLFFGM